MSTIKTNNKQIMENVLDTTLKRINSYRNAEQAIQQRLKILEVQKTAIEVFLNPSLSLGETHKKEDTPLCTESLPPRDRRRRHYKSSKVEIINAIFETITSTSEPQENLTATVSNHLGIAYNTVKYHVDNLVAKGSILYTKAGYSLKSDNLLKEVRHSRVYSAPTQDKIIAVLKSRPQGVTIGALCSLCNKTERAVRNGMEPLRKAGVIVHRGNKYYIE